MGQQAAAPAAAPPALGNLFQVNQFERAKLFLGNRQLKGPVELDDLFRLGSPEE